MDAERWKRIEELYHAAAERDGWERSTFLDAECANDFELRQEVDSLLGDGGDAFLEKPVSEAAYPMFLSPPVEASGLAAGTRLGPYEIVEPIGSGGMGEVYCARDTRLDRTVAIKILPGDLAARPGLRERFEREARIISNLNHPHICTLYDVGQQEGIDFLVMEHLKGETLEKRLSRGPLPLKEALRVGVQIADALDKAHRGGVTHRDLKPANIMLTKSGAKLLDFGVAKQAECAPARPGAGPSPPPGRGTLTLSGAFLGTLQYMSPEQLQGKEADERSDIFAFGSVVYEMITGRKAFERPGETLNSGAAGLSSAPAAFQQSGLPSLLERTIYTCLALDPDERWQSMADVLIQFKLIRGGEKGTRPETRPDRWPRARRNAAAVVVPAVMAALSAFLFLGTKAEAPKISFEIPTWAAPSTLEIVLSPTAGHLAAVMTSGNGEDALWLRPLEHLKGRILSGTLGASMPFWSPDGGLIGFFSDGKLKKTDVFGAPATVLTDAPAARGGTWSRDGVIVFAPSTTGPLYRVSASGSIATQVTDLDESRQERAHRHPYFLPDGDHFLYLALSHRTENSGLYVGSLSSPERRFLIKTTFKAAFAPPEHILYVREGALVAQRFDAGRLELTGEPIPVTQDVGTNLVTNSADFTASANGTLAYRNGGSGGNTYLMLFDRDGKEIRSVGGTALYESPVFSPDSQRVAMAKPEGSFSNIWILDLARGPLTRFTFGSSFDTAPLWSSDGTQIVYASNRGGAVLDLYQRSSNGLGQEEVLFKSDHSKFPEDWSPDGQYLLFREDDLEGQSDLLVLSMGGDRDLQRVVHSPFRNIHGRFSPNGKWIAYVSNESGRNQVYIQGFPNAGRKLQISTAGGFQPQWRGDGRELVFISGRSSHHDVLAVDIVSAADGALQTSVPRRLFSINPVSAVAHRNTWDVTPDYQRFLINSSRQTASSTIPITVVMNWTAGANISH